MASDDALWITVPEPPGPLPPALEMWTLLCDIGDALRWAGDLRELPAWLVMHSDKLFDKSDLCAKPDEALCPYPCDPCDDEHPCPHRREFPKGDAT